MFWDFNRARKFALSVTRQKRGLSIPILCRVARLHNRTKLLDPKLGEGQHEPLKNLDGDGVDPVDLDADFFESMIGGHKAGEIICCEMVASNRLRMHDRVRERCGNISRVTKNLSCLEVFCLYVVSNLLGRCCVSDIHAPIHQHDLIVLIAKFNLVTSVSSFSWVLQECGVFKLLRLDH